MEDKSVILFTIGCPKCTILEKKLEEKHIEFEKHTDLDEMLKLGFKQAPMLKVGEDILDFTAALKWVKGVA